MRFSYGARSSRLLGLGLTVMFFSVAACGGGPAGGRSTDAGDDGANGDGHGNGSAGHGGADGGGGSSTAGTDGATAGANGSAGAGAAGADGGATAGSDGGATAGANGSAGAGAAGADGGATAGADGGASSAGADGGAAGATDAGACPSSPDAAAPPSGPDHVTFLTNVTVATVAGTDVAGDMDGTVAQALFSNPVSVILEPAGSLVVCDFQNNALRRITMPTGTVAVSTLTKQTGFYLPYGMTYGIDGTLYVDTDYNTVPVKSQTSGTIWKVSSTSGVATVVAQNLGRPRGLATLPDGRLVLGDFENQRVRLLDPTTGAVTDLAGHVDCPGLANANGSNALFNTPYGVGVLPNGTILVADEGNHVIRAVSATGDVTTYAGDGGDGTVDGPRASSRFSHPTALAIDTAGDVFVADYFVHRIRRIAADGTVTTVAGDGTGGYMNGAGSTAELYGIEGITVTPDGKTLFVADGSLGDAVPYNRVRVITIGP
jgi:sugar lactone lactonase YvrE